MIEELAQNENTLKKTLEDKVQNERELTEERNLLLSVRGTLVTGVHVWISFI